MYRACYAARDRLTLSVRSRGQTDEAAGIHRADRRRGDAWPLAARAQERVRRVGVLMHTAADEPEAQARLAAFLQGLQEAGWDGRPQRADRHPLERRRSRAPAQRRGGIGRARPGRHPGRRRRRPWRRCNRRPAPCRSCSPSRIDPVGNGFVDSLARPGGNATGFIQFEYGLAGKWLELLKEIAPRRDARGGPAGARLPPGSGSGPSSRPWRRRWAWS